MLLFGYDMIRYYSLLFQIERVQGVVVLPFQSTGRMHHFMRNNKLLFFLENTFGSCLAEKQTPTKKFKFKVLL